MTWDCSGEEGAPAGGLLKPSHWILLQPVAPPRAGVSPLRWAETDRGIHHISRVVDSRGMSVGAKRRNPCSQRENEAGSSAISSAASACCHDNAPPLKLACVHGSQSEGVHIPLRRAVKKKNLPCSVCAVDMCVLRSRSLIWNLDSDYMLA